MLHKLTWRYATKEFDPNKKVDEETITSLLKLTNLSASSYGLQPYEFVVVSNQELQDKLVEHSFGQQQIADASHVVVICAKTEISEAFIDQYVENIAEVREQDLAELQGYADMMKGSIGKQHPEQQLIWSQKQCYIALGTLLLAAADAKVDSCPMEGFDPEAYNELLGLSSEGLHATIVVPLGYRSVNDSYQHLAKVRRPLGDIVTLKY
jgi:nitroreductase/dihydropteridine reductase